MAQFLVSFYTPRSVFRRPICISWF